MTKWEFCFNFVKQMRWESQKKMSHRYLIIWKNKIKFVGLILKVLWIKNISRDSSSGQLIWLITKRSEVRILLSQLKKTSQKVWQIEKFILPLWNIWQSPKPNLTIGSYRVRLLKKKFTKKFDYMKMFSYLCKPITKRLTLL